MAFAYKKTEYENIYEWLHHHENEQCFYCHDQEQSELALNLIAGKGICKSCLENFEVGNLAADRHVVEHIQPEVKTREEMVKWLEQHGTMELVDVIDVVDEEIFVYHFINEPEKYKEYQRLMENVSGVFALNDEVMELMKSYTKVEVSSEGSIHIEY